MGGSGEGDKASRALMKQGGGEALLEERWIGALQTQTSFTHWSTTLSQTLFREKPHGLYGSHAGEASTSSLLLFSLVLLWHVSD